MDGESQGAEPRVGADVAGRLVTADVLLAGRQGQNEAAPPICVDGLADQPPGKLAHELLPRRHQPDGGAAEVEGVAQRLSLGGDDVRLHGARRLEQAEGNDLGDDHDQQRAGRVTGLGEGREIADPSEEVGILHDHAGGLGIDEAAEVLAAIRIRPRFGERDAEEAGAGFGDIAVMGMQPARQHRLAPLGDAAGHHHRLGARRRPVVHRGVGDLAAGEQRDLGLELEQVLQGALRHFRLIGGVGGQELAALDQVIDGGGNEVAVDAGAEEGRHPGGRQVAAGHGGQTALHLHLAGMRRQVDRPVEAGRRRHVAIQVVDRRCADGRQHLPAVVGGEGQIPHP